MATWVNWHYHVSNFESHLSLRAQSLAFSSACSFCSFSAAWPCSHSYKNSHTHFQNWLITQKTLRCFQSHWSLSYVIMLIHIYTSGMFNLSWTNLPLAFFFCLSGFVSQVICLYFPLLCFFKLIFVWFVIWPLCVLVWVAILVVLPLLQWFGKWFNHYLFK